MDEAMKSDQVQTCPQCDNHCSVNDLKCGRGRKYFSVADGGSEHGHGGCGHGHPEAGLAGLLHQCGRFARHSELEDAEMFQILTDEEKNTLQALLEKLTTDWRERCGEEGFGHCDHGHHGRDGEKHHHKHEGHGK